jgi:hypothetical protein
MKRDLVDEAEKIGTSNDIIIDFDSSAKGENNIDYTQRFRELRDTYSDSITNQNSFVETTSTAKMESLYEKYKQEVQIEMEVENSEKRKNIIFQIALLKDQGAHFPRQTFDPSISTEELEYMLEIQKKIFTKRLKINEIISVCKLYGLHPSKKLNTFMEMKELNEELENVHRRSYVTMFLVGCMTINEKYNILGETFFNEIFEKNQKGK